MLDRAYADKAHFPGNLGADVFMQVLKEFLTAEQEGEVFSLWK